MRTGLVFTTVLVLVLVSVVVLRLAIGRFIRIRVRSLAAPVQWCSGIALS